MYETFSFLFPLLKYRTKWKFCIRPKLSISSYHLIYIFQHPVRTKIQDFKICVCCNFLTITSSKQINIIQNDQIAQIHHVGVQRLWLVLGPIVSQGIQAYRQSALCGSLSKRSQPVFMRVSEKTTENSGRLGRQAPRVVKPGTSRLPVLSTERHTHLSGQERTV